MAKSCAPPIPAVVYLETGTVPTRVGVDAVQEALASAVNYWRACGWEVSLGHLTPVEFADSFAEVDRCLRPEIAMNAGLAWVSDGEACDESFYLTDVLRHEIGHLLGLPHEPKAGNVMYRRSDECEQRIKSIYCEVQLR